MKYYEQNGGQRSGRTHRMLVSVKEWIIRQRQAPSTAIVFAANGEEARRLKSMFKNDFMLDMVGLTANTLSNGKTVVHFLSAKRTIQGFKPTNIFFDNHVEAYDLLQRLDDLR